jgi:hypothetical protein
VIIGNFATRYSSSHLPLPRNRTLQHTLANMADIDEELLALAGDASSDEEDAPMNISRDSSVTPGGRDVSSKSVHPKKTAKKGAKRGQNDSEEEGEA